VNPRPPAALPTRDDKIAQCLRALGVLTQAARQNEFKDLRYLQGIVALAYRLMELDFKRLEGYLCLAWIFALLREYSRAWQVLLHAEKVCTPHADLDSAKSLLMKLVNKPVSLSPVEIQAVSINFDLLPVLPVPEARAVSSKEGLPAWADLKAQLESSLISTTPAGLSERWQALQGAYHPLQALVLQTFRAQQGD